MFDFGLTESHCSEPILPSSELVWRCGCRETYLYEFSGIYGLGVWRFHAGMYCPTHGECVDDLGHFKPPEPPTQDEMDRTLREMREELSRRG